MPATVTITPGFTVDSETLIDAAVLNALARPLGLIPDNSLPPAVLQMDAVLAALAVQCDEHHVGLVAEHLP